jgi:hypothetical protein
MLVIAEESISKVFEGLFSDLPCQEPTRAYVISVFSQVDHSKALCQSDQSLIILFSQARESHNFSAFQELGDRIFFLNSFFQEHLLKFGSREFFDALAQTSYWECFKLINRKWELFRELAENLPIIEDEVKLRVSKIKSLQKIL